MNVAFQGVPGAYSELAARELLGSACTPVPCTTFRAVFARVESRRAAHGIIPIENSLAGSIHENYDLLLAHRLHITAETHLRIEHVLLCHPSTNLRHLRSVRSHPQALAQCSDFFRRNPRLLPEPYFDTAGAAQSVASERAQDTGAIASALAARRYGLRVLRRNVQNSGNNFTRFLLISRTPWHARRGMKVKTSIAFIPAANRPGILFHILGVFALRDIDLLKIESRPDPKKPFEYLFYIDLAGGPEEQHVARAFEHLREVVSQFRILGTYPQAGVRRK
ncbi:MAG: prephenate dehydratase [Bacteroidota bacterium]